MNKFWMVVAAAPEPHEDMIIGVTKGLPQALDTAEEMAKRRPGRRFFVLEAVDVFEVQSQPCLVHASIREVA